MVIDNSEVGIVINAVPDIATQQLIPDKNEGITHCKWFKNTEIEKVKNNCHILIQYLLKYLMDMPYYKKYISTKISSDI